MDVPWIINCGKTWMKNSITNIKSNEGKENVSTEFIQRLDKLKIQESNIKIDERSSVDSKKIRRDLFSHDFWDKVMTDSPELINIYGDEKMSDSIKNSRWKLHESTEKKNKVSSGRKINFQNEFWFNESKDDFNDSNAEKYIEDEFAEPTRDIENFKNPRNLSKYHNEKENIFNSIKQINHNRQEYNSIVFKSDENDRVLFNKERSVDGDDIIENKSEPDIQLGRKFHCKVGNIAMKEKYYANKYLKKALNERPKSYSNIFENKNSESVEFEASQKNLRRSSSSSEQMKLIKRPILINILNNSKENLANANADRPSTYFSSLPQNLDSQFFYDYSPTRENTKTCKLKSKKLDNSLVEEMRISSKLEKKGSHHDRKLNPEKMADERIRKKFSISGVGTNKIIYRNSNVSSQIKLSRHKGKSANFVQPVWRPAGIGRIPDSNSTTSLIQKRRLTANKERINSIHEQTKSFANKQANPSEPVTCKKHLMQEHGKPMEMQGRTTRMCKSLASTKLQKQKLSKTILEQAYSRVKVDKKNESPMKIEKIFGQISDIALREGSRRNLKDLTSEKICRNSKMNWPKSQIDKSDRLKRNDFGPRVSRSIILSRSCTIKNFSELIHRMNDESCTGSEISLSDRQISSSEIPSDTQDRDSSSTEHSRTDCNKSLSDLPICSSCFIKGANNVNSCKCFQISLESFSSYGTDMPGQRIINREIQNEADIHQQNHKFKQWHDPWQFSQINPREKNSCLRTGSCSKLCKVHGKRLSLNKKCNSDEKLYAYYANPENLYSNNSIKENDGDRTSSSCSSFTKYQSINNSAASTRKKFNIFSSQAISASYEKSDSSQTRLEDKLKKNNHFTDASLQGQNSSLSLQNIETQTSVTSSLTTASNTENSHENDYEISNKSEDLANNFQSNAANRCPGLNNMNEILASFQLAAEKMQNICRAMEIYANKNESSNINESRLSEKNSIKCKYRDLRDYSENPEDPCDLIMEVSNGTEFDEEYSEEDNYYEANEKYLSLRHSKSEEDNLSLCMVVKSFEPEKRMSRVNLFENIRFSIDKDILLDFKQKIDNIQMNDDIVLNEVKSLLRLLLSQIEMNLENEIRHETDDLEENLQLREKNVESDSFKHCLLYKPVVVSRNNLLPIVYGAVCSLMFWCLQFSVTCEP